MGSIPTPSMVRVSNVDNFIYPNLHRCTQLQMSTNIVGKVLGTDSRPGEEGQYAHKLVALLKPGLTTGHY